MRKSSYFFFAHQDDEFGVYSEIQRVLKEGNLVICSFLTDGATELAESKVRNLESVTVLRQLGVDADNIHFPGTDLNIRDGQLPYRMQDVLTWTANLLHGNNDSLNLYFPAWEGGHQDHDALHAALVIFAARNHLLERCWQFPLYHSYRCPGKFFRTLSPLRNNGSIVAHPIRWRQRYHHLLLCLSYPSQLKTWLALFPFVALNYLFSGKQKLQHASRDRIFEPPHKGLLFYERRGKFKFQCLLELIVKFYSSL